MIIPNKENVNYSKIYYYNLNDLPQIDKKFKTLDGNRQINKNHVNEICTAIISSKYGAKYIAPIRIDINSYNIIDGQHRLEAFKKAWSKAPDAYIKVIYEDYPQDTHNKEMLSIIADINSTNKNWSIANYIKKIETEQDEAAIKIKEFAETHWLTQKRNKKDKVVGYYPRYAYSILFGKNISKDIKNGVVHCTDEIIEQGQQLHTDLTAIILKLGYSMNSWFESFAQAWYTVRKMGAYDSIIKSCGINRVADIIKIKMHGLQPVTSKAEWISRLTGALDFIIINNTNVEVTDSSDVSIEINN